MMLLVGCTDESIDAGIDASTLRPCWDVAASAIDVDLGTGALAWEALPPFGGRAELVHGSQGGYHFYGRVRVRGVAPDIRIAFRVTALVDGRSFAYDELPARRLLGAGLQATTDGYETGPERVILTAIRQAYEVVGMRVRFEVCVQDVATGRAAFASREITIVDEVQ